MRVISLINHTKITMFSLLTPLVGVIIARQEVMLVRAMATHMVMDNMKTADQRDLCVLANGVRLQKGVSLLASTQVDKRMRFEVLSALVNILKPQRYY